MDKVDLDTYKLHNKCFNIIIRLKCIPPKKIKKTSFDTIGQVKLKYFYNYHKIFLSDEATHTPANFYYDIKGDILQNTKYDASVAHDMP